MTEQTALFGSAAVYGFLCAHQNAPEGTDIEIGRATGQDGAQLVTASVGGQHFALTPEEAEILAGALESSIRAFPTAPEVRDFATVIMGLRESVRRARSAPPSKES